jgi:hypothetical protein
VEEAHIMAQGQTKTEFFESIMGDKNVSDGQLVIFFTQAYRENEGKPDEQARLLKLLTQHRPVVAEQVASRIVQTP